MDAEVSKVFKPDEKSKSSSIWSVLGFLLVSLGCFSDKSTPIGLDISVFVACTVWYFYSIFSSQSESITITPRMVIRCKLTGSQSIPISDIRIVKMTYSGESNETSLLMIETNESTFYMGDGLTDDQVKEAVAYILEQIRLHYPVNYHDVTTEHLIVEKFWRK